MADEVKVEEFVGKTRKVSDSLTLVEKQFGRQGRGNEGEKYIAEQLSDESVNAESFDTLAADLVELSGNDLTVMRQIVILGYNKYAKNLAGGSDEASKIAAMLVKAGLSGGKSKADVAAAIRSGALKF